MPKNIAIFASGSGSNAENIIRYFQNKGVFNFPVIISNRSDAYIHQRAESLNIKSIPAVERILKQEILSLNCFVDIRWILSYWPVFCSKFPNCLLMLFRTGSSTFTRLCCPNTVERGCMAIMCIGQFVLRAIPKAVSPFTL